MNDEQVLCLPTSRLHELGVFTGLTLEVSRYVPAVFDPSWLSFRPRALAETDPTWLQLIPYVVLMHGCEVFHYTRGKSGGESRLHALKSIGIGGHINPTDRQNTDLYRTGLMRELCEEIALHSEYREHVFGLVYDPSTPVGQVHLGIVHLFELQRPEVQPLEAGICSAGFATLEQLERDSVTYESWSQFVIRALLSR